MQRMAVCLVLGVVGAVVGCGGNNSSSEGSGGTGTSGGGHAAGASATGGSDSDFNSSVDGSQELGSLSDGDKTKLCNELAAYSNGSAFVGAETKFSCGVIGLLGTLAATDMTDAGLQAACKAAYDECAATVPAGLDATQCTPPGPTCTATVDEYSACLNDTVALLNSIDIPACNTLTAANLQDSYAAAAGGQNPTQPASCKTYQAKCPDSSMPGAGAM